MKYTEEDLRKAFKAGVDFGAEHQQGSINAYDEDGYIDSLNTKIEEGIVSFTYSFLAEKMDWEKFCDLTGTNEWYKSEGGEIKDTDIFYVTESKAKQFNLI